MIVTSNEMAADIQHEITSIHNFIKESYCKRFPELERLIQNPLDYARVVRRIGNDTKSTMLLTLVDILPASTIMTISMATSSSTGEDLNQEELKNVLDACDTALSLDESRNKILSYVEGRMQVYAPNLSAIVGCEIATKLIGAAGGLQRLSNMPSSNLYVLGKKRVNLEGFSSANLVKHYGYIASSDIVKNAPQALEKKICRLIANKCTLASRLDANPSTVRDQRFHGDMGMRFREEIEKKIEKWLEPPPKKKERVLPAPDDLPRKRRGGARMRKYKQRYAITEMRKRAMRLPFGQITEEVGNSMKSLGMLGMSEGSGIIRANAKEDKGFQMPKPPKKRKIQKGQLATPGFATSVYAITPVQGLELKPPESAKEKEKKDPNDGYFSTTGGFLNVGQKRKLIT
uniref:Nop domain-containing protein n=1 Tax=Arcella intermedia TaxID=1963864 RepID=A0A6B2L4P6_9EUKA